MIMDYCERCNDELDWNAYPSPVKNSPGENYHFDCWESKMEAKLASVDWEIDG